MLIGYTYPEKQVTDRAFKESLEKKGALSQFWQETVTDKVKDKFQEMKDTLVSKTKEYFVLETPDKDVPSAKLRRQEQEVTEPVRDFRKSTAVNLFYSQKEKSQSRLECDPQALKLDAQRTFGGSLDKTVKLFTPAIEIAEKAKRHQKEHLLEIEREKAKEKNRGKGFEFEM